MTESTTAARTLAGMPLPDDAKKRVQIDCDRCPGKMHRSVVPRWGRALFAIGCFLMVLSALAVTAAAVLMFQLMGTNAGAGLLVGGSGIIVTMVGLVPVFLTGLVFATRKSVWCCAECDVVIERA